MWVFLAWLKEYSNSYLVSACYIISLSDSIIKYHIEVYTNKTVTICGNLMLVNMLTLIDSEYTPKHGLS
jgi:hypothetical protein